jgi:hypothetical protein
MYIEIIGLQEWIYREQYQQVIFISEVLLYTKEEETL